MECQDTRNPDGTFCVQHGLMNHPLYHVWSGLRNRCNNPRHKRYNRYGGRGIKVCKRWDSFINFLMDMGERPEGMSLDRRDNDGDYTPDNCRWATAVEQNTNRSTTRYVEWQGKVYSVSALAKLHGIKPTTLHTRLTRGWDLDDALLPKRKLK